MFSLISRACNSLHVRYSICDPNGTLNSVIKYSHLFNNPSSRMSADKNSTIFIGTVDRYNGVLVCSSKEGGCCREEFNLKLDESLKKWMEAKRRAVWFRVGKDNLEWVPVLANKGFKFHHAKEDAVTMYKWICTGETDGIPLYAHTTVGVGGLVVNDKSQVLVVSEKYYNFPHWKLPGGLVDPDEDLVDAVIREVQEETGVKTEFHSLLTMRHAHQRVYGCSDLYITFALKPQTTDIIKCDREIQECMWMDIKEYLSHPHVSEMNRLIAEKYLEYKEKNLRIEWKTSVHEVLKFPVKTYCVV